MKKIFSFVILLSLLLTATLNLSFGAYAVPGDPAPSVYTDSQGVTYELSKDGTYYTAVSFDKSVQVVEIPAYVEEIPVKVIGYGCFMSTTITGVTLPNTITVIEGYAFCDSYYMSAITIPASVTEIGDSAFCYCDSLIKVNIPASVTKIGVRVFGGCINLNEITVDSGNTKYYEENNCLIEKASKTLIAACQTSVNIPSGVVTIAYGSFSNYADMTSVVIPDTVTTIENNAFWACKALVSVNIPKSVTSIENPFGGCQKLTSINVSADNKNFKFADGCLIELATKTIVTGLSNAVIPFADSVEKIGVEAFAGLSNLTAIIIPDNIKTIGEAAFFWCDNLESIKIGKGVTTIEAYAFKDCTGLLNIKIPETVKTMGANVFEGCANLEKVTCDAETIPSGWDKNWLGDCEVDADWAEPTTPPETSDDSSDETSDDSSDSSNDNSNDESEDNSNEDSDDNNDNENDNDVGDTNPEAPTTKKGDVNGSGNIDSMDYVFLKRAYFGTYVLPDMKVGDVNNNGNIDSMDYVFLKRAYFGTYVIAE